MWPNETIHIKFMKYKLGLTAFFLSFMYITNCGAQMPDSIRMHVDSSLTLLKEHSLYTDRVNWEEMRKSVMEQAQTATTKAGTFTALKAAFDALGDKHAAYYQYEDHYRIDNSALLIRYSDSIKAAWSKGPGIVARIIDSMGYISIPYMAAGKQEDIDKYANWLYDAISGLLKHNPKGWIVDLRLNGGGNIRPMLAGVAMFFDDGIVSYYIDRNGHATDETAFVEGDVRIDGVVQASIQNKIPRLSAVKVAVLTGPGTASAGEGVAAVFRQRERTKIFGKSSAGLANATNGFVFNQGETYFLISVAHIGDPNKKALPEMIIPDVLVEEDESFGNLPQDAAVRAAINWLQQ